MITVCFDDGKVDCLKWCRYLKQYDIRAVLYINPETIGNEGFLTLEHLKRIKNDFNCVIANHLYSHKDYPGNKVSFDDILKSFNKAKEWLDSNDFKELSSYVAIPYGWMGGKWSDKMISALLEHCSQIRDVSYDGITDVHSTKRLYSVCDCAGFDNLFNGLKKHSRTKDKIFGMTFHSNEFIRDNDFCYLIDFISDFKDNIKLVNEF